MQHHAAANGMAADALLPAERCVTLGDQAVAGGQHQPGGGGVRPADRPVAYLSDEREGQCARAGHDRCEQRRSNDDPRGSVDGNYTERWWNPAPPATPAQAAWAKGSVSRSVCGGVFVRYAPSLEIGGPSVGEIRSAKLVPRAARPAFRAAPGPLAQTVSGLAQVPRAAPGRRRAKVTEGYRSDFFSLEAGHGIFERAREAVPSLVEARFHVVPGLVAGFAHLPSASPRLVAVRAHLVQAGSGSGYFASALGSSTFWPSFLSISGIPLVDLRALGLLGYKLRARGHSWFSC